MSEDSYGKKIHWSITGKKKTDKINDADYDDGSRNHSNTEKKDDTIIGNIMDTVTDLFKNDDESSKNESGLKIHAGKHDHYHDDGNGNAKEKTGIHIPGDNDKKISNHGIGGVTIDGDSNASISNT